MSDSNDKYYSFSKSDKRINKVRSEILRIIIENHLTFDDFEKLKDEETKNSPEMVAAIAGLL